MRKFLLLLSMAVAAIAFTSCEQDEDTIYDRIVGRTWIGNLGFTNGPAELESGVRFGRDGFGTDEQYYYDNQKYFGTFNILWDLRGNDLYIDYGCLASPRELRGIYVNRQTITGELYIDGYYVGTTSLQLY